MTFEQALVAMKQGYAVQRISTRRRLNAICLFMKNGKIYTRQTHELSEHKINALMAINVTQILADDWTTKGLDVISHK